MTTKCPVCGKKFVILYPHLYVYRRGSGKWLKYFCSYTCVREFDRKDIKMKLTLEHKKKAVEIALDGGSPIRYLESCGSANAGASWAYIKKCLQKKDPETYEKLPAKYKPVAKKEKNPVETPETPAVSAEYVKKAIMEIPQVKVDGPLRIETPESNRLKVAVIGKPETAGELKRETRYTVTAIRYPDIGEFYYDRKYNTIDWRTVEGDEVSMHPTGWKILMQDLKEIMTVLGVEM